MYRQANVRQHLQAGAQKRIRETCHDKRMCITTNSHTGGLIEHTNDRPAKHATSLITNSQRRFGYATSEPTGPAAVYRQQSTCSTPTDTHSAGSGAETSRCAEFGLRTHTAIPQLLPIATVAHPPATKYRVRSPAISPLHPPLSNPFPKRALHTANPAHPPANLLPRVTAPPPMPQPRGYGLAHCFLCKQAQNTPAPTPCTHSTTVGKQSSVSCMPCLCLSYAPAVHLALRRQAVSA